MIKTWDPYAQFRTHLLTNGLTIHAAEWEGRPWQALTFVVHTGARSDPHGLEGLAHFVEHLISVNASVEKREIERYFREIGGDVNLGSTSYDAVTYSCFVPADQSGLARVLDIFGNALLHSTFSHGIENEREVILQEYATRFRLPYQHDLVLHEHKVMCGDTSLWLQRFVRPLGAPESIRRITAEDLQSYYSARYVPANVSIVSVGGVSSGDMIRLLSDSPFSLSKAGTRTEQALPVTAPLIPLESRNEVSLSKLIGTSQTRKTFEYWTQILLPGTTNVYAVRVAREMLAHILFQELRENRQWTYSSAARYTPFAEFGFFGCGSDTLSLNALKEIDEVVERCIEDLQTKQNLFGEVKTRKVAQTLLHDATGRNVCTQAADEIIQHGKILTLLNDKEGYQSLSIEDIREIARLMDPRYRWTQIVLP